MTEKTKVGKIIELIYRARLFELMNNPEYQAAYGFDPDNPNDLIVQQILHLVNTDWDVNRSIESLKEVFDDLNIEFKFHEFDEKHLIKVANFHHGLSAEELKETLGFDSVYEDSGSKLQPEL